MMKLKKTKTKRAFTLIEVIVCISLLSLIGGLFAYKAKDLFSVYNFRSDKRKLINSVELARHLSVSYRSDVEMLITEEKLGYSLVIKSDEPALEDHNMLFKKVTFTHIDNVSYLTDKKIEGPIKILFSSSGWLFPAGSLQISSKGKGASTIDLGINISTSG
ncbi:MAG: hypothetical protein S4CHLAM37_00940 [Chlamydiia bacterium]|nr:hypothetical protein [Chlamydiia bacterium]